MIPRLVIAFLGLAGLLLANHIRHKKNAQTPLTCPLNGKCEEVVTSKYSTLFGIPLEYWGMAYYGFILISYSILAFYPNILPPSFTTIVIGITVVAFLYSLYLTLVQAMFLKSWCTWCLVSAGFCTSIFLTVILYSDVPLRELFNFL